MGAPRARLLWSCLLLPVALLRQSGGQDLSCAVSPGPVDWTQTFNATCLNFSGLGLSLPRDQPLQARHLQVLDLSRNGLQALPGVFFADLQGLRTLIVTENRLSRVDASLSLRCDLELRADCSCALAPWLHLRRDNCSGSPEPLCEHPGGPRNVSSFLRVTCPRGLAPGGVAGLVAATLVLAVGASALAWRLRRHRGRRGLDPSKVTPATPGTAVTPATPARGFRPRPEAPDRAPGRSTADYENIVLGQPAWPAPRSPSEDDTDFYMNYKGGDPDPDPDAQPVYCNLGSRGRAPSSHQGR